MDLLFGWLVSPPTVLGALTIRLIHPDNPTDP